MLLEEIVITESVLSDVKDRITKTLKDLYQFFTDPADYKKVLHHFQNRMAELDELKLSDRSAYYRELLKVEEEMREFADNDKQRLGMYSAKKA